MDKADFERYLQDRYFDQINWYDKKSMSNQKWYNILQWGLIVLAALTPVLVAIQPYLKTYPSLKWLPVTTAVAVAILSSALKTFHFQENWINYRTTCETLKKEVFLYQANVGEYERVADKDQLFVERVEELISRENTLWIVVREKKEKEGTEQT